MLKCDRIPNLQDNHRQDSHNPVEAKTFLLARYLAPDGQVLSPPNPQFLRFLFPLTLFLVCATPAVAQIVPDSTLGAENSVVTPLDALNDQIDGGAIRGSNLFHSFQDFNIDNRRGAYFSNPTGIENILTRVTGGNPSNIFGTLGVLGNANLFLVNPNGIVFGPNARLDVGGSFFASTAEGINFLDGYQFSATNPDIPPLLTINVPIGLQFGANPGGIGNQSVATQVIDGEESIVGLQVPPGRTLGLIGGDIALEGGRLTAEGGRVELGSVGGNNTVSLTPIDVGFALGYAGVENYQDIVLSQQALVDTSGERGGDVQVRANRLLLQEGSSISAETRGTGRGGTLNIDATESVQLVGSNVSVSTLGTGDAGEVNINTRQLRLQDGGIIFVVTVGEGRGGILNVNATEFVELVGTNPDGSLRSSLAGFTSGSGDGGTIHVTTDRLIIRDGGSISLESLNNEGIDGRGGMLSVNATESVELSGTTSDGTASSRISVLSDGTGDGGIIDITTGRLIVRDGAAIALGTDGEGRGGNLTVNASESVEVLGTATIPAVFEDESGILKTRLNSNLTASASGTANGGSIDITTGRLLVGDGANISLRTTGEGRGGTLTVNASESVELIGVETEPTEITIFQPEGEPIVSTLILPSQLSVSTDGVGDAGEIAINTGRLSIQDGGSISLNTNEGAGGRGGTLTINATEAVEITGTTPDGTQGSEILASTSGLGDGGNVTINTGQLLLQDGAQIFLLSSSPEEGGRGGTLTVNAAESVELVGTTPDGTEGSGISADTFGGGDSGNVTINTGQLLLQDGARISLLSSNLEQGGRGGTLTVNAAESVELVGTTPVPTTGELQLNETDFARTTGTSSSSFRSGTLGGGDGGEILINTGRLSVRDGASILASTSGAGRGGTIVVNATESVEVVGAAAIPDERIVVRETESGQTVLTSMGRSPSDLSADSDGTGDAGAIEINTRRLSVRDGADISVTARDRGQGGSLIVNATESVELSGNFEDTDGFFAQSSLLAFNFGTGNAGEITISTERLSVRDGAGIVASSFGLGSGGTITVNATESVEFIGTSPDGFPSRLFALARSRGDGGSITIETGELRVADGAEISVSSRIFNPEELSDVDIADFELAEPLGNPGSIDITANDVRLENGGLLDALSSTGRGGNIDVRARNIQLRQGIITASGRGNDPTFDGNIDIDAQTLVLLDNSQIITSSTDPQGGSNITFRPIDGENGSLVLLQSPDSLINAQGELSVEGEIEPDPAEVPEVATLDAESQLSRGCQDYEGSEFYVTGRGGIPPSPYDSLGGSSPIEIDWVEAPENPYAEAPESRRDIPSPATPPLIEAQGWVVATDGTIVLTAQPHRGTPAPPALSHPNCQDLEINSRTTDFNDFSSGNSFQHITSIGN